MTWIRNIATNYLRFCTTLTLTVLLTPFIISHVGQENYGIWVIVYAVIGIISLSDLGFATAAIKFLSEADSEACSDKRNSILGALCIVYSGLTILCAVMVSLGYIYSITPAPDLFLVLGIATTIGMGCCIHRAALIASGHQDIINWIAIAAGILQALLIFYFLTAGAGLMGIALSHCIALSLQSLVLIPLTVRIRGFSPAFRKSRRYIVKISRFSAWALIANTSFLLILRIDPLIIEHFTSLNAVAIFAIGAKIAEQALLFNKQFSNALTPLISRFQGPSELSDRASVLIYSTKYLLAIATPLLVLLSINAENLILLWLGPEFIGASTILQILCIAVLFSTMQFNAANVNGMSGYPHVVALSLVATVAVKFGLMVLLVTQIGLIGGAIATLIATTTCESALNIRNACKITRLSIFNFARLSLFPGIVCSIPTGLLAFSYKQYDSFLSLLTINACYGGIALLLFYILFVRDDEKESIKHLLRKKEVQKCVKPITT